MTNRRGGRAGPSALPFKDVASVNVDASTLQDFRDAVYRRHGKLYGNVKAEATEALARHTAVLRGRKPAASGPVEAVAPQATEPEGE